MAENECTISWQESYYDYVVGTALCFVFHILLFIHSLLNLDKVRQRQVTLKVPILITTMQIMAIIWNINEFIRHCIVSRYYISWFNNTFYCYFSSFLSRALVPLFYTLLLNLLLIKLYISFSTSFHPLSSKKFYILLSILYINLLILFIALFVFGNPACIATVYYWDINVYAHKCVNIIDGIALYTTYYSLALIVCYNGLLGYIFTSKLLNISKEKSSKNTQIKRSNDIYAVMIKNTILTLTLCTSSMMSWILWFLYHNLNGFGNCFIYLDILFNCLMISFVMWTLYHLFL